MNARRWKAAALLGVSLAGAGCVRRAPEAEAAAAAAPRTPRLLRLAPESIAVLPGMVAEVELRGSGFDANRAEPGNTVTIGPAVLRGVPASADGTLIRVVVPDAMPSGGEAPPQPWYRGRYPVTVRTPLGSSDTLFLTIIAERGVRP